MKTFKHNANDVFIDILQHLVCVFTDYGIIAVFKHIVLKIPNLFDIASNNLTDHQGAPRIPECILIDIIINLL